MINIATTQQKPHYNIKREDQKNRDFLFDNAKGILISLVVFAHLISPLRQESTAITCIYKFIYLFHMPFFIFIAGTFSKHSKINKEIQYFIIYIMFQIIFKIITNQEISLYYPSYALWFLLSLCIWKQLLRAFKHFKHPVFISLLIGLTCGYLTFIGPYLSLKRALTFLPFFILGYTLSETNYNEKIRQLNIKYAYSGILAFFIITTVFYTNFSSTYKNGWLTADKSYYKLLGENFMYGPIFQLSMYCISTIVIFLLLRVIPEKKTKFISAAGKSSLCIYILHIFIIIYLRKSGFYNHSISLITLGALSVIIVATLSSPPATYAFNLITNNQLLRNNFMLIKSYPKKHGGT